MSLSRKSFLKRIISALTLIPFFSFTKRGKNKNRGFLAGSGSSNGGSTIQYDSPWQYVVDEKTGRLNNGCLPPVIVDTGEPIQLADVWTPTRKTDKLRCEIASSVSHIFNNKS